MAEQETLDTISDAEVFSEAMAKTPSPAPEKEAAPEPKAEAPKVEGKARDEKGRFAPKTQEEPTPEPTVAAPKVEAPKPEPEAHIPSWRLKEESDARRAAQEALDQERRQREAFQQQLWQLQQQLKAKEKPEEPIDIFANPAAWEQSQQKRFDDRLRAMEGNFSLRLAAYKHGENTLRDAFQALASRSQSGDDSIRQMVMNASDPGEALVGWYKRENVLKTVGDDPEAFLAKALDEALNNPEFLAKALEKAKGVASTQPTQVSMPPSLNKATASSPNMGVSDNDASDGAIFSYAMRRA